MPQSFEAPSSVTSSRAGVSPYILVVDDNQDAADSLGALFEILGATVVVAYDGKSALEIVKERPIDIVILDISMPGMDGYEVARRIRQCSNLKHLFLVALTGWAQDAHKREAQAAGFDHHLLKPTDISSLEFVMQAAAESRDPVRRTG